MTRPRTCLILLGLLAAALLPAISACHWPTIRAQTHVLVALAGTIGAMRLHQLAIDANTAAHDQASARLADISFTSALKDLGRGDDREMGRWLNNRAENSSVRFRR